jgi:hypothetical protein
VSRFAHHVAGKFVRSFDATCATVRTGVKLSKLIAFLWKLTGVVAIPLALAVMWSGAAIAGGGCNAAQLQAVEGAAASAEQDLLPAAQVACVLAKHVPSTVPAIEAEADAALLALCGVLPQAGPAALHIVHASTSLAGAVQSARGVLDAAGAPTDGAAKDGG